MAEIGSLEWIFEEMDKSEYRDYSEYFKVKDYKKHMEGNIYVLDEDINIDKFMDENNFTGGCYFDQASRLVVAYVLEKDIEELHKKYSESNLRWQYKIYYPNTPEIVTL